MMSILLRRAMLLMCAALVPASAICAQAPERPKKTLPTVSRPASAAAKAGAKETSCDGALEIIPSQPMTFARKRRPTRLAPASPETRSQKNKAGESQN